MYESIVEHKELGKYKVLRARDPNELAAKVEELKAKWNFEYSQRLLKEKEAEIRSKGEEEAFNLQTSYKDAQDLIEHYLYKSVANNYNVHKAEGKLPEYTEKVNRIECKEKPNRPQAITFQDNPKARLFNKAINIVLCPLILFFNSILLFLLMLFLSKSEYLLIILAFLSPFIVIYFTVKLSSKFSKKITVKLFFNKIDNLNKEKIIEWENECKQIDRENKKIEKRNEELLNKWKEDKEKFLIKAQEKRNELNKCIEEYDNGIIDGVVPYFQKVLKKLPKVDNNVQKDVDIEYNDENKILLINYPLPDFENLAKLPKEVKYVSSKGEFKTTFYSDSAIRKMYDSLIYQMIFSIAHAIFSGDRNKYVDSVVINGFLDTIDRSIGKKVTVCISSLHINRNEFEELDLQLIDPKQCFKRLKGVAGVQMDARTPVAPIMQLNKEDKRFVESYDVAKNIDVGTNLAAMDWQDFENLIRELFEWKFSTNGGECKITQASRDGGVDAIAFDPDPILGGKIIIQAKRYTNVVGVSAVRDLYGTLINEGASKGILITTSDYGSDAHKFAKGKPITLLNGNNLLHLLNEMGTKAYINIREAKKMIKDNVQ